MTENSNSIKVLALLGRVLWCSQKHWVYFILVLCHQALPCGGWCVLIAHLQSTPGKFHAPYMGPSCVPEAAPVGESGTHPAGPLGTAWQALPSLLFSPTPHVWWVKAVPLALSTCQLDVQPQAGCPRLHIAARSFHHPVAVPVRQRRWEHVRELAAPRKAGCWSGEEVQPQPAARWAARVQVPPWHSHLGSFLCVTVRYIGNRSAGSLNAIFNA